MNDKYTQAQADDIDAGGTTDAAAQDNGAPLGANAPSPGDMLRAARDAAGLSREAVAEAAKLSASTIAALEADDFAQLNEPVYVRGYYRKCALVLEVDAESITRAYDAKARPQAPALPAQIPLVAGSGGGLLRRLLRGLVILIVLGLIVMGVMWLLQPGPVVNGGLPLPTPGATSGEGAPATQMPDASAPAMGGGATTEAAPASPADDAAGPAPTAQAEATPATAQRGDATTPQLRIEVNRDTWLRVRDADGRTLINDLISAGDNQRFQEQPPLEVFFGYAPGVELNWRGRRVDISDQIRGNNTALVRLD